MVDLSSHGDDENQQQQHQQQLQDDDDELSRFLPPLKCSPLDEYIETKKVRDGSNGITFYQAVHNVTGSFVTIKRVPTTTTTTSTCHEEEEIVGMPIDLLLEVTILKEFSHPNIVTLIDVDHRRNEYFYFIFEQFFEHDLKTFIDSHQRCTINNDNDEENERVGLSLLTIRNLMKQLLSGVAFCHGSGILHRNLQPKYVSYKFLQVTIIFSPSLQSHFTFFYSRILNSCLYQMTGIHLSSLSLGNPKENFRQLVQF